MRAVALTALESQRESSSTQRALPFGISMPYERLFQNRHVAALAGTTLTLTGSSSRHGESVNDGRKLGAAPLGAFGAHRRPLGPPIHLGRLV